MAFGGPSTAPPPHGLTKGDVFTEGHITNRNSTVQDGFGVFSLLFYSFMRMHPNSVCLVLNVKVSTGSVCAEVTTCLETPRPWHSWEPGQGWASSFPPGEGRQL